MQRWWRAIGRVSRMLLQAVGALALALFLFAALGGPWPILRWLGTDPRPLAGEPDYIVMMGGGGIPSESGLMRAFRTAELASLFPRAKVVVAMPFEPGEGPGDVGGVARELMLRGVARDRLMQEGQGRHTREQAVRVREMLVGSREEPVVLVVTSPDHLRRSLLAFRKAGFARVHGSSVFSQALRADLAYGADSAGEPDVVPALGRSLLLRYRLWDNLELEARLLRELAALLYYRAHGWI